jgi:hypothetical protein
LPLEDGDTGNALGNLSGHDPRLSGLLEYQGLPWPDGDPNPFEGDHDESAIGHGR